ncbi:MULTISPECIES: hypothetical protein [unclassified Brachybacterium]|uniref:hypothetical protein n=1 Tax=unclassified Brachybacterium TaxID=2623841 RepID=UPI0018ED1A70|nr:MULTISPECIES: hypothetical protein [unclassified Brachybacterium]
MIDQLPLLAEAGGVPAPAIGIGMFLSLMALLGITWLISGNHQRHKDEQHSRTDGDH